MHTLEGATLKIGAHYRRCNTEDWCTLVESATLKIGATLVEGATLKIGATLAEGATLKIGATLAEGAPLKIGTPLCLYCWNPVVLELTNRN